MPAPQQLLVPGHPFPESLGPGRLRDVLLAEVGWNSPGIHLLGSARAPHHAPGPRLVPGASPQGPGEQRPHCSARFLLGSPTEIIFTLFGLCLLDSV